MENQQEELEYRMYFFVNRSLSPIQKGIQAGHAALQFVNDNPDAIGLKKFLDKDKTWIILDVGTSNSSEDYKSSMELIAKELETAKITYSCFYEPDLNNCLTAICILVEERAFNGKKYDNFQTFNSKFNIDVPLKTEEGLSAIDEEKLVEQFTASYLAWFEYLGGQANVFLSSYLEQFNLAN